MGTTLDALTAGSATIVWVVAIEGWSELFTNGDTAAVATAWDGTGWTTVKGGLFVEMDVSQALNPDEPFTKTGSCTLTMAPQGNGADDVFGVAIGRKTSPAETYLAETLDETSDTIAVQSTAGFGSSGYAHIGTECIAYTGTGGAGTFLTGCTRGCFSPFGSFADLFASHTTMSFGHPHRVVLDQNSVGLQPVVSTTPKVWSGRWIGVWCHRVVGGVVDVKAQAELVFAGKLDDWRDDPNTGAVVLSVRAVADYVADAVVGGSQWEGKAQNLVYLGEGLRFGMSDASTDGSGSHTGTANVLTVVAGTPGSVNEIAADFYSLGTLCSALSAWTASETAATRLLGAYSFASPVTIPGGGLRTKIYWELSGLNHLFRFSMPSVVATFFGFSTTTSDSDIGGNVIASLPNVIVIPTGGHFYDANTPPSAVAVNLINGVARMRLDTTTGTIFDQIDSIPGEIQSGGGVSSVLTTLGGAWGIFAIDDSRFFLAQFTDNGDGTVDLAYFVPFQNTLGLNTPNLFDPISLTIDSGDPLVVRQVYVFEQDPSTLITSLLIGSGSSGYNTPYAALPGGCGLAIPYELVKDLVLTMTGLAVFSGGSLATFIDKPTKMADLLRSDLMIRWAFFCWRGGQLSMGVWRNPTITLATASLDDTNKAEPGGHVANQRSATTETTEWLRPVVKIRYNRDAADPRGDAYSSTEIFEDRVAVDDAGGAANTVTISLRNVYREFSGAGQSLNSLLANFLEIMPLVSRPARKVTRSIDSRLFLSLGLGDIVLLSDLFARDPETGLRGLTNRPAMVTKLRYSFGGETTGGVQPMGGEVDLLFSDSNPDRLGAGYVPSADIDDQYTTGSFTAGYDATAHAIKVLQYRYSETTELIDAVAFQTDDNIIIVERDPADPDSPLTWSVTVLSVVGDVITLSDDLTSFDTTKRYHVLFDDYTSATTSERAKTYQSWDPANEDDILHPYLYGPPDPDSTYTTIVGMAARYPLNAPNAIELIPSGRSAPHAGRDVSHEAALVRLADNLIDYKLALQAPWMSSAIMVNDSYSTGAGRVLVAYFPAFLNLEILSNAVYRLMALAPWAWSTDGTETSIRVTFSRERPSFSTTQDVPWTGTYGSCEWTGITATTPGVLTTQYMPANIKDFNGEIWVSIECGYKCATRGLPVLAMGPRVIP